MNITQRIKNIADSVLLKAPTANPTFTGTVSVDSSIVFEGSIADGYETTLTVVNPTADRTLSLPNESGTLATQAYVGIAKAWVNFKAIPLSGTYSQAGTVITVTMTAHGMTTGMIANLDFTSGTATDGIDFVVTVTGADTFTVVGKTSVTTSGNVTRNNYIRSAFNVSGVIDLGVGAYGVILLNNMGSTNFCAIANGANRGDGDTLAYSAEVVAANQVKISGPKQVGTPAEDSKSVSMVVFAN